MSFADELRAACIAHGLIPPDRDALESIRSNPFYRALIRHHSDDPPGQRGGKKTKNRDKVKAARKQRRRQK